MLVMGLFRLVRPQYQSADFEIKYDAGLAIRYGSDPYARRRSSCGV
jgi:hypothetical protein